MANETVASRLIIVVALVVASASPTLSAQVLDPRQVDLALTLECVDSTHITFAIRNVGDSDTAVRLGSVLGNGGKYTIDDLQLRQKTSSGQVTESHYWPRSYPVRVGGTLGEWIQAIPARSSYLVSAEAGDFFGQRSGRTAMPFVVGVELSLRLTILDPSPQRMLLTYWSGTLTSNSCMP